MTTPPPLIDPERLDQNRRRALRMGPDLFLHDRAAGEIQERLTEVNRAFTSPAVVTDFAGPWRAILPQGAITRHADVLALPVGAHDLVIHAFGLHRAADPVGQIIQCRRALAPDGLFLAVSFGNETLHELRTALAEAEVALTGGLSARVLPMAEIRALGGLLQRAGLALPVADNETVKASYRSIPRLARDLRAMGEGNALASRSRRSMGRTLLHMAEAIYATSFPAESGRLEATFDLIYLTGWAPHDSQQKPLRPGSAVQRLEDALRAAQAEHPAPDDAAD